MFDKALLELPGMKAALALLFASSLAQAVLLVGQSAFLALALADLWAGADADACAPLLLAFFACFALGHVVSFAQGELLDRYARKRALDLRSQVLSIVFESGTSPAYQNGTAATALSVTEGTEDVARYLRMVPQKLCAIAGVSIPVLVALFVIDWVSGVIAFIAFPVIVLFMVVLGRQASARAAEQFAESQRLSNHFLDAIRGIEAINALGAGKRACESVFSASERMRASTVRTLSVATLSSAILDLITVFGIAAIAMMLAFRLLDGSMGLSTALTALVLAPEFFSPVRSFASDFHASLDGRNALAAMLELLKDASPGKPVDDSLDTCAPDGIRTFEAHGIGYSHTGDDQALDDVSFAVSGCMKVGIVGQSGAGKSTLVDLIAGLRTPHAGGFSVNGQEVELSSSAWRRQLHYIPQHPHVFDASLLENMRFYAPDVPLEDVERAVDAVGLRALVDGLPQGLETVVGEGGRALSGGEAQRVALARAMLDERRVLVFDEPTAHLDIETELELKRRMLECMRGKLVFFATHRLHWLSDMDFVVVLEDGEVAESGTPEELLSREGALSRFVMEERRCVADMDSEEGAALPEGPAEPAGDNPLRCARNHAQKDRRQAAHDGETGGGAEGEARLSWLKGLVRPFRKRAAAALALGVASACCGALLMFVSGYLICRTAWPETTLFMVMVPVALVQVFGIGRPITHYFERLVSHDWVFRVTSGLRKLLFQAALEIAGDPADPRSSGEYLEMLADDIGHLQNLYLRVAFPAVIACVLLVCAFAFSCAFDIVLALGVLAIGVIAALAMPAISHGATKEVQQRVKALKGQSFGQVTDDVIGALDWTLAGRAGEAVERNRQSGQSLLRAEAGLRRRIRVVELASALALGAGVVAITCLAAGVFQSSGGGEHFIAAFALGMFPLMQMFVLLPGAVSDAPAHRSSVDSLEKVVSGSGRKGGIARDAESRQPLPATATLSLDGVSYRYPEAAEMALRDIDLHVPEGQKVAVVGKSGSGKTTLAALVRGALSPVEGSVEIGGAGMWAASGLVCYIPQSAYVFDASLRENLALANPKADDESMLDALAKTGLGEKVATLDGGLDAHVGETGTGFSGGEAHRLTLSRALLSQRPVMVLDEPFSAVDPKTELLLLDTLFEAFEGKTLIVITHHLMDIGRFDRVILLQDGAIALDGAPRELLQTSPHFRALIDFDRGSSDR